MFCSTLSPSASWSKISPSHSLSRTEAWGWLTRSLATSTPHKPSPRISTIRKEADKLPSQGPLLERLPRQEFITPPLSTEKNQTNTVYSLDSTLLANFPLPTKLTELLQDKPNAGFLWRAEGEQIWQRLQTEKNLRIVLNGPRKVGKSVLLLQLVHLFHHLRLTNASCPFTAIIYLPRISRWIAGYYSYESLGGGQFRQPNLTLDQRRWISFLNPHISLLQDPTTWRPLLMDPTTLIIADEINSLYAPTGYRKVDGINTNVAVSDLEIPALIKEALEKGLASVIASPVMSNPSLKKSIFNPSTIQANTFSLNYWNETEIQVLLNYFLTTQQIIRPHIEREFVKKMHFVSGGCPAFLLDSVYFDSIYRR